MFTRSKAKIEARVAREKEKWRNPVTKSGSRVGTAEIVLYVVVGLAIMALLAVAPKSPIVHLLVFGLGAVSLSAHGQRIIIPFIYNLMAAKFGWPDFEAAVQEEGAARQKKDQIKNGGSTMAPAGWESPIPVLARARADAEKAAQAAAVEAAVESPKNHRNLDDHAKSVLGTFLSLEKEVRRSRVHQVLGYFQGKGFAFDGLEEAETDEEKALLGELALKKLAKQNGLVFGGAA